MSVYRAVTSNYILSSQISLLWHIYQPQKFILYLQQKHVKKSQHLSQELKGKGREEAKVYNDKDSGK